MSLSATNLHQYNYELLNQQKTLRIYFENETVPDQYKCLDIPLAISLPIIMSN